MRRVLFTSNAPRAARQLGALTHAFHTSAATALPPMRVIYGSQTGTAMGFAMQLAEQANTAPQDIYEVDPEDFAKVPEPATVTALILSCFGKGEPTDSAKKFYKYLMDPARDGEGAFKGFRYTVFGLGNSGTHTSNYNVIGRAVDARLQQLGAVRVFDRGEGDASGTIEMDFDLYMNKLLEALNASEKGAAAGAGAGAAAAAATTAAAAAPKPLHVPTKAASAYHSADVKALQFLVVPEESAPSVSADPQTAPAVAEGFSRLTVRKNTQLTPGTFRPIHEVQLAATPTDTAHGDVPVYHTGDHVSVRPTNASQRVMRLCRRLGLDPAYTFRLTPNDQAAGTCSTGAPGNKTTKLPITGSTTVFSALAHQLAVNAQVSPQLLRILASHATVLADRDALLALTERDAYERRVRGGCLTLGDVLDLFPSTSLPLDRLVSTVPQLLPRYYSISSPTPAPGSPPQLDITLRHVRVSRPEDGSVFNGTCSAYLATRVPGQHVDVAVRPSSFRLPTNPATPVLMVAGGIGIAPFRAFLLDRIRQAEGSGTAFGNAVLLYGTRDESDGVYADLIARAIKVGALTAASTGYAAPLSRREKPAMAADLMQQHEEAVWQCLGAPDSTGSLYVCGGASGFGSSVVATVKTIFQRRGGMTPAAADERVATLLNAHRFVEDLAD